jgi:hypothetical protein
MQSQEHAKMPVEEQVQKLTQIVCILPQISSKKRSWVQMDIDDEEEEQQEKLREEENKMKNILAARRFLYSIGQYELEEGEILE